MIKMSWQEIEDIIPKDKKDLTRETSQEFIDSVKKRFQGTKVMQYYRDNNTGGDYPNVKLKFKGIEEMFGEKIFGGVYISLQDAGHRIRDVFLQYEDYPKYTRLQNGFYVSNTKKGWEWVFILA